MRGRGLGIRVLVILTLLYGIGILGCDPDTRYRTLSFFFDGVPPPGTTPVPRKARRPKAAPTPTPVAVASAPEVTPTPEPERPAVEKAKTYAEVLATLPKDSSGEVDWIKAEEQHLISPRPSLDPAVPPIVPMDLDIVFQPKDPMFKAVFPHKIHTRSISCDSCHPAIFQMQKGADPITMDKIFSGEYCGKCHGKVAFDIGSNCARCHAAMGGG